MTNQPGTPAVAAAGLAAAASGSGNDGHDTDGGVPVGAADAEEDRRRASGEEGDDEGSDGSLVGDVLEDAGFGGSGSSGSSTDDGVPVGAADAEEDRRRASRENDSE